MNPFEPMNINDSVYVIAIDNTNKYATLTDDDLTEGQSVIIYNDSDEAVFIVTGNDSPFTAVWPSSSTVPKKGKVIGPKGTQLFKRFPDHKYISAIQETSGTGNLYIMVGRGS